MNFFHRIGLCAVVLGAVGCDKDDPEIVEPVAEPETVIIGCAGATGADVDVRTQLGDDGLSVYWEKTDEIRLWAREKGATEFLSGVQNVPFQFHYYSPSWSRVGFKGTINEVETTFDATKKYDYFAVSPAPADGAVSGTRVTYPIPAEQTGEYDGRCDILTAELKDAPALKAGDDNPSVNLEFNHHIHLLKFTIKSSAWEENRPIRAVELTFPSKVVGQLTVDATDPAVNELAPVGEGENAGKKVLIKFPAGKERKAGDTFIAMIAPTTIGSGETIGMRIIGTLGETSAEIPAAGKSLAGGHTTPVDLNVPAKNTFYKILKINVSDGSAGGMGKNTLGERLQVVRLKGNAGTFTDVAPSDEYHLVEDDGRTLECIVSDDSDGVYEVIFVSEKSPDSKCPWPVWNRSKAISGQTLKVEYESESAWIRTIDGYSTVQTGKAILFDSNNQCSVDLSIPYFFEEDFSGVSNVGDKVTVTEWFQEKQYWLGENNDKKQSAGSDLGNYFRYPGWTGNQIRGYSNYIEIKTRVEATRATSGLYNGRLDSAPMKYWKDGSSKRLHVQFDYYHYAGSSANYTRKMNYGTTDTPNPIEAYYYATRLNTGGNKVSGESQSLSVNNGGSIQNWFIASPTSATRLSWELEVTGTPETGSHNHFLRLSNLKVSIIE